MSFALLHGIVRYNFVCLAVASTRCTIVPLTALFSTVSPPFAIFLASSLPVNPLFLPFSFTFFFTFKNLRLVDVISTPLSFVGRIFVFLNKKSLVFRNNPKCLCGFQAISRQKNAGSPKLTYGQTHDYRQ